jgi:FtsP/CotA-like multicopper oxidase with cupredoxin domain
VDPKQGRPLADETLMVMHGFNTTFDGEGNQLYAVNGIRFHYMREPVRVKRGELVRVYLVNILEYDAINSFHLHRNFFDYYPTGTRLEPAEFTDTVMQAQGQRGSARSASRTRDGSCSTRTRPSSPSWAGWAFFEVVE